jgi:hypothetical protein
MRYFSFDYSGQIDFAFHESTETALQRVIASTQRPTLLEQVTGSAQNMLVGYASRKFVKLSRVHALKGDVFKPYFYGTFVDKSGGSVLSGQFRMELFWRILLMLVTLLFAGVGALTAFVGMAGGGPMYVLGGLLVIGIPLGALSFVKALFYADVEWITKKIEAAGGALKTDI